MNKTQIRERLPDLQVFIHTVRNITNLLIITIMTGYGLAIWFWWQTQLGLAVFVATLSFLLYYVMRRYSVALSSYLLRYRLKPQQATATLQFINEQKKYKTDDEIISQLIKILPIVQAQVDQQPASTAFNDKDD
jgi:hypothetical protein